MTAVELSSAAGTWLWVMFALLLLCSVIFFDITIRHGIDDFSSVSYSRVPERKEFFVVTFFIPTIAAVAYLSMALGKGYSDWGDHTVFWGRHLERAVTTPLILIDLALLAGALPSTGVILAGTSLFTSTCWFAATSLTSAVRYVYLAFGAVFLLVCIGVIALELRTRASKHAALGFSLYKKMMSVTALALIGYIVVEFIGQHGAGVVGDTVDVILAIVCDFFAKVLFPVIMILDVYLFDRKGLQEASRTIGG